MMLHVTTLILWHTGKQACGLMFSCTLVVGNGIANRGDLGRFLHYKKIICTLSYSKDTMMISCI